ncbi:methyl-CpG-binding domain-containing protein 9-like [Quercus robur]|uniref:methyl-CpG-binding domain-containing protein 9-like n=1 Tax=Quercus robur TaxID=38942 RepID=UPI002162FE85|nr:methyl-CpG-binding domain-containing protein 9-like [Quercus robur]
MELGAKTRMMELTDSSDELSRVRDESRHLAKETRSGIRTRLGLGIDLNEIPSPSLHETLPNSFEVVRNFHDKPPLPLGGPTELPSAENDVGAGNINHARCSSGACGACGNGCERGFHIDYAGAREKEREV